MQRGVSAVYYIKTLYAATFSQVIPSPLRTTAYSMDVCIAGVLSVASTPLARPAILTPLTCQGNDALACSAAPATPLSLLSAGALPFMSITCTLARSSSAFVRTKYCTCAE